MPDGSWRYVRVTLAKGAVATAVAFLVWPYLPPGETLFEDPDRMVRKWAFACWLVFSMFPLAAVWCSLKSIQGAWMASR